MQLHTRTWGSGDRIALLVHGMMSDHRAWRRLGPLLAHKGYRAIAVDLRGHGQSPRGPYSPELFAQDLVDTLPAGAELALGHSLGGLALSLAIERLKPARAIYCDPAWRIPGPGRGLDPAGFAWFRTATREQIAALNPRWDAEDVDIEVATLALWDPTTGQGLSHVAGRALLPARPVVPSLVQLADGSFLLRPEDGAELRRRGFEVRMVTGAGHTFHRDDFDGFVTTLDGWI